MALVDERLVELGWEPIATEGKVPRTLHWQTLPRTVSTLADERRQCPNATNTGIRCGQIAAVDIDLIIEGQVAGMRALAFEVLGETPLERTGRKGTLLVYRNADPCAKINVTYQNPNGPGRPRAVEILGAGQQFVAYGLHPDTGLAYRWATLDPTAIAPEELPLVTPERLREFAARAVALLASWGYGSPRMTGERVQRDTPEGFAPDSQEAIAEAQRHLRTLVARGDVPRDGNRNAHTHAVAVRLCCIGVGEDTCVEMMREWIQHGEEPDEGLEYVVGRAYNHPAAEQNPPGSELGRWAPLTGDVFKAALDRLQSNPAPISAAAMPHAVLYPHTRISDAVRRPPPTYHDRLQLLTKVPSGSVNMIFARHSNYKTTLVFNHLLATMAEDPELRAMMVIGEGSGGFGPKTVQAGIALWNTLHPEQPVTPEWFDARFALVEEMPQLTDDASVAAWCKKYLCDNPWGVPHIIVFDTLATAMAGANLSATESATAALRRLTQIAVKLRCDIFFVHHQSLNKEDPRGAGSEFWANNVESVLFLSFDRDKGYVEVKSLKNKWGAPLKARFGVRKAAITLCDGSAGEHVATYELPPEDPARPENEAAAKRQAMMNLKNEILRHVAFGGSAPPTADKLREAMGSTADTIQIRMAVKELLQLDYLVLKKEPSRLEIGTARPPKHAVEH